MSKKVCMICGKEIRAKGVEYSCNVAVVGPMIHIRGHPVCIDNVENLAVIPNRFRVEALTRDPQETEQFP